MSRVLLLDTSFAAKPVHDWLIEQRFDVWTIGNCPGDVLAQYRPERYLREDYADIAAVQRHVDCLKITHVVPGCTDISIDTAHRLRNIESRFDSPKSHTKISDKAAFGALCRRMGIAAPSRFELSDLPIAGRLIVKPANAFSGRGISIIDGTDLNAARKAFAYAQRASPTRDALIEAYIDGSLFSYSAFLENYSVTDAFFVREGCVANPYSVDVSYVVPYISTLIQTALHEAAKKLARELQLTDGLLHIQFIWDGTTPWLIECCRRCPGDLYPQLITLTCNFPYAGRYAAHLVGKTFGLRETIPPHRHILRYTATTQKLYFDGVRTDDPLPLIELYPLLGLGHNMREKGRAQRVALMFMEFPTAASMQAAFEHFIQNGNQTS